MEKTIKIYWIVIILIGIIALFSIIQKTEGNDDLVKYIGFAGTIVSIILGLFAIFYSVITNNQSTENFGKLKETVSNIEKAIGKVNEGADAIAKASAAISEKVDTLPKHLKDAMTEYGIKGQGNQVYSPDKLTSNAETVPDPLANQPDPDQ